MAAASSDVATRVAPHPGEVMRCPAGPFLAGAAPVVGCWERVSEVDAVVVAVGIEPIGVRLAHFGPVG